MSTAKKGPPKHQNATAWKPDKGVKKKDKELGGKGHPYPPISGVCCRCKDKIQWRRKYGKYKALAQPAKCHNCSKRCVLQAYHALCSACAKEKNVCAKCCNPSDAIVGRDAAEEESERKQLESALSKLRERDKRTLLRLMEKGSTCPSRTVLADESDDSSACEEDGDDEEASELESLKID